MVLQKFVVFISQVGRKRNLYMKILILGCDVFLLGENILTYPRIIVASSLGSDGLFGRSDPAS